MPKWTRAPLPPAVRARAAGVFAIHPAAAHGFAVAAAVVAGRSRAVIPSAALVAA